MAEKQLTPEELQQVKSLQEQSQQVTIQLGTLEIKKTHHQYQYLLYYFHLLFL